MTILTPTIKEKQSSITFEIYLKQTNDILAHSLLDFITSRPNIQSIMYSKQNFMLNHKNPILIDETNEVYICLLTEDISEDDTSQTIEIYSYTMNVEDLRAYIKKIEYNYTIKIQNKHLSSITVVLKFQIRNLNIYVIFLYTCNQRYLLMNGIMKLVHMRAFIILIITS
jgi:hypothetical protein